MPTEHLIEILLGLLMALIVYVWRKDSNKIEKHDGRLAKLETKDAVRDSEKVNLDEKLKTIIDTIAELKTTMDRHYSNIKQTQNKER